MNFQNEQNFGFESYLNGGIMHWDIDAFVDHIEDRSSVSNSLRIDDVKFEEIIMKKLKINTIYSSKDFDNKEEENEKCKKKELIHDDTTQEFLDNSMPEFTLEGNKGFFDDIEWEEESFVHEEKLTEELNDITNPEVQKIPQKQKRIPKRGGPKENKLRRFGKKDDWGMLLTEFIILSSNEWLISLITNRI